MEITLVEHLAGKFDPIGVVERDAVPKPGEVIQLTTEDAVVTLRVLTPFMPEDAPSPAFSPRLLVERLE